MAQPNPEQKHIEDHTLKIDEHIVVTEKPAARRGFKLLKEIAIFVVILGVGVLAAWGINQISDDDKDDAVAELPVYGTPSAPVDNSAATDDGSTDDGQQTYQTPEVTYGTPVAPPAPTQAQTYQNAGLGFSMTLPIGWTDASESTAREIVFQDTLHAGVISSVEVYDNTSGDTLDSLMNQLNRTPNVSNVRQITINGVEWIEFSSSAGTFNRGIVTIKNNRIYYLNGELSKPGFADDLKF